MRETITFPGNAYFSWLKRSLLTLGMSVLLFSFGSMAQAAVPAGTMTGTGVQTLTVGTSTALNDITITDGSGPGPAEILDASNIIIIIPAGIHAYWDNSITTLTSVTGNGSSHLSGAITYNSGATSTRATIAVTSDFNPNEAVTISGLKLIGQSASTTTALTFSVDGGTDNTKAATGNNIIVAVADPSATMTVTNIAAVGGSGTIILGMTAPLAMTTGDYVLVTFPANYDTSGVTLGPGGATTTGWGGATFTPTQANNVLTLTLTATAGVPAATAGTIIIPTGIKSLYASGASTVTVTIKTVATVTIATSAAVTIAATTAATTLAGPGFAAGAVSQVGDTFGAVDFQVTFPVALATGDTIKMTFPGNYDISGITNANNQNYHLDSNVNVTVAGQLLTLTLTGAQTTLGETIDFPTDLIIAKYAAAGNVTVLIEKATSGDDVVTNATVAITTTTAATTLATSTFTVGGTAGTVGGAGTVTYGFTVPVALAAGDTIKMNFPANYDISTLTSATGLTSAVTVGVVGQDLTLTLTGTQASGSTPTISFQANKIVARYAVAAATNVKVLIEKSTLEDVVASSANIGINSAIGATTSAVLTGTSLLPNSYANGANVVVTVAFTTVSPIRTSDAIEVTFPSDGTYVLTNVGAASTTCPVITTGTLTTGVVGNVVTITRAGGGASVAAGTAVTCTISGVKNPPTVDTSVGTSKIHLLYTGDATMIADKLDTVATFAIVGAANNPGNAGNNGGTVWTPGGGTGTGTGTTTTTTTDTTGKTTTVKSDPETGTTTVTTTDEDGNIISKETLPLPFTDVVGHWAIDYITKLYDWKVVSGRTEITFAPDETLTRAEMIKIAVLLFGIKVDDTATAKFSDVAKDFWGTKYIAAAQTAGIVSGYSNGKFGPNDPVTRSAALKILILASKKDYKGAVAAPFKDVSQKEWFAPYINAAYVWKIVSGKTADTFAPADNVTRAEMAKMAVKMKEMMDAEAKAAKVSLYI